jgi:hypothetical protein
MQRGKVKDAFLEESKKSADHERWLQGSCNSESAGVDIKHAVPGEVRNADTNFSLNAQGHFHRGNSECGREA